MNVQLLSAPMSESFPFKREGLRSMVGLIPPPTPGRPRLRTVSTASVLVQNVG